MEHAAKCSQRGFVSNKEENRLWRGCSAVNLALRDTPSLENPFRLAGQPQTPGRQFSSSMLCTQYLETGRNQGEDWTAWRAALDWGCWG